MITVLGLIAWFLISCYLTFISFGIWFATVKISGSLDRVEKLTVLIVGIIAVISWYFLFSSFDIELK